MNPERINQFPKVSVAMATYNGGRYLREQLDSILLQTLAPVEIVVSDDGSTDDTEDILKEYKQKGVLEYFVNERTLGYIANFKKAVSLCQPDHYIAISDQDDIWLPSKIESAMKVMLEIEGAGKPAMVYSDLTYVDENKEVINSSFRNEIKQDTYDYCLETLLFGGFVNGCTMLMNPLMGQYFSTIPDSRFATHDTWIALIAYTFGRVGVVPGSQILYRRHESNATNLINITKPGRIQRLRTEISRALAGGKLFERELAVARLFKDEFHSKLNIEQSKIIERFIQLDKRGYIARKLAFRMLFRGKWK